MKEIEVGNVVKCEVSGVTDYGVFVKVNNIYSGLIHISEISEKFVSNVERLFIIGDIIEAKIVDIDEEKKQLKLSIKENKEKKRRNKKIEEKGDGFKPLKENLDMWVKERLKELEKTTKSV